MLLTFVLLFIGFVVLISGASWLLSGATALARRFKVSELVIGLTIVAFGTSAPELIVNIFAAADARHDIAFGNVIGSNLFNLFIILGISGLIYPLKIQTSSLKLEIPISILAVVVLALLSNSLFSDSIGILTRWDGIILLVFFSLFVFVIFKTQKKEKAIEINVDPPKKYSVLTIIILIVSGLGALVLGGNMIVKNAIAIAESFGVSEKIIGLTIVAAGTSLPELATSLYAAYKKNADIAVGNVIGSNIFNIFAILGISSLIHPLTFNTQFNLELMLIVAGTLFLMITMFTGKRMKLDRWEALLFMVAYIVYVFVMVQK